MKFAKSPRWDAACTFICSENLFIITRAATLVASNRVRHHKLRGPF